MALCACMPILARAQADNTIVVPDINKQATKVLPITISGFSGETLSVIRFDLEVFGMQVVPPEQAEFRISGSNNGNLQGKLTDANDNIIGGLNQIYQGASARSLAEARKAEARRMGPRRRPPVPPPAV